MKEVNAFFHIIIYLRPRSDDISGNMRWIRLAIESGWGGSKCVLQLIRVLVSDELWKQIR